MKARILNESAFVREDAAAASAVVAELRAGDEVVLGNTIRVSGSSWVAACAYGKLGFLPGDTRIHRVRPLTLAQGAVDVLTSPAEGSDVTMRFRSGDRFTLTGVVKGGDRQWLEVRTDSEAVGFIPAGTGVKEASTRETPAPLLDAVVHTGDSQNRAYCEETAKATLDAIASDIIAGKLTGDMLVSSKSVGAKGRLIAWNGTLREFARRHERLSRLYWPIRHYSRAGLFYGLAIGCGVGIFMDGLFLFQVNQMSGAMLMAFPVCAVVTAVPVIGKLLPEGLRNIAGLAGAALPFLIGLNGLLSFMLGGAVSGAVQLFFPAMAVGGVVGIVRRPREPRAPDADKESAVWRVGIPVLLAVLVETAYFILVRHYVPALLPAFVERFRQ